MIELKNHGSKKRETPKTRWTDHITEYLRSFHVSENDTFHKAKGEQVQEKQTSTSDENNNSKREFAYGTKNERARDISARWSNQTREHF